MEYLIFFSIIKYFNYLSLKKYLKNIVLKLIINKTLNWKICCVVGSNNINLNETKIYKNYKGKL